MDPKKPPELPKKQDPKCPNGYKGDVGGKEACIPSYGYNGVDFAPKTKYSENDKTRTETTTKTECAEGKCTTTVTEKVTDKATVSQRLQVALQQSKIVIGVLNRRININARLMASQLIQGRGRVLLVVAVVAGMETAMAMETTRAVNVVQKSATLQNR